MTFYYIGHRGTRKHHDENTFGAFLKALNHGADYVEFDVRKTKDNQLIIIHDRSLNRTTNGNGLVENLKYSEIKNFQTKNHEEPIPRLSEVLTKLTGRIKFMVELKGENVLNDLIDLVDIKFLINNCILSGRKIIDLQNVKKISPKIRICYNITKGIGFGLHEFLKLESPKKLPIKFDMVNLRSSLITKNFIKACQKMEIAPISWDFIGYENPIKKIKSLIKIGIKGILFDDYKNIPSIKHWLRE